eukprot:GILJ01000834.1.p1 GENE.GILJ01000834.1~~GILJ01000834.1.p1  ORF type:complete len:539 (+),score=54.41 GILJ01000834.1:52-1668(+)
MRTTLAVLFLFCVSAQTLAASVRNVLLVNPEPVIPSDKLEDNTVSSVLLEDQATFVSSPTGLDCENFTTCDVCTKDPNCGWCNGFCYQGAAEGPLYSNCTAAPGWRYNTCGDVCSVYPTCSECISKPGCGYCSSLLKCLGGDHKGSTSEECPDIAVNVHGVHAVLNAWNHNAKPHSCEDFTAKKQDTNPFKYSKKKTFFGPPKPVDNDEYLQPQETKLDETPATDFDIPPDDDPEASDQSNPPPAIPPLHGEDSSIALPWPKEARRFNLRNDSEEDTRPVLRIQTSLTAPWLGADKGAAPDKKFLSSFGSAPPPPGAPAVSASGSPTNQSNALAAPITPRIIATPVFFDDFDNGLEKWSGRDGNKPEVALVTDPTGLGSGKVLSVTECSEIGSIFSKVPYQSASSEFRIDFDYLGAGLIGEYAGGLVGFCNTCINDTVWVAVGADRPYRSYEQIEMPSLPMWRHYAVNFKYNSTAAPKGIRVVLADSCEVFPKRRNDVFFENIALYAVKGGNIVTADANIPDVPTPSASSVSINGTLL